MAATFQKSRKGPGDPPDAECVGFEDPPCALEIRIEYPLVRIVIDARVVDQRIEPPEAFFDVTESRTETSRCSLRSGSSSC